MGNDYSNNLVSVIIPVFNSARFLRKTVDSALNQTYSPLEIVLIDDHSDDDSPIIIEEYQTRNANIISHRLERNSGAAVARNKGLELAGGRFIAFLDSDDIWLPEKIEKQMSLISEKSCGFCFTAYDLIDSCDNLIRPHFEIKDVVSYRDLLTKTWITTSTVLIDRLIVHDFLMPQRRTGQDYATWLMILRGGFKAYGINKPLVRVRKIVKSLSSNKIQNIMDVWQIQTELEKIHPFRASINTLLYICNALAKRFL